MAYLSGTTITLKSLYKDVNGQPIDPPIIKLRIMDSRYNQLQEYSIGEPNKVAVGEYEFQYVIRRELGNSTLFYEWYAELDGLPKVGRKRLDTVFV
jgi:hypothetical protein